MSERNPGWYWVKTRRSHLGKWEAALLDEHQLWYLAGCDQPLPYTWPLEIGPRIPTPDEPWVCVPVDIAPPMRRAGQNALEHGCYIDGIYADIIAAAPKPEDT